MYMQCKAKLFSNPVKSCEECKVSSAADLFQTFHGWPAKRRTFLRFQQIAFLYNILALSLLGLNDSRVDSRRVELTTRDQTVTTKIKAIITMLLIIPLYQMAFPGYVWLFIHSWDIREINPVAYDFLHFIQRLWHYCHIVFGTLTWACLRRNWTCLFWFVLFWFSIFCRSQLINKHSISFQFR